MGSRLFTRKWPLLTILLVLAIHLSFSYSRFTQRFYFPFERWPAGRAERAMPPPLRQLQDLTDAPAEFRNLTEGVVVQYMRFHQRNRFNPNARKLIYTGKGNASGFGDRFRGILHAYLLALLSRRVLLIAWLEPFPIDLLFESAPGVSVLYDPRIDPGPLPVVPRWHGDGERRFTSRTSAKSLPFCACNLQDPGTLLSSEQVVVVGTENYTSMEIFRKALSKLAHLPTARELAPVVQTWTGIQDRTGLRGAIFTLIFRALLRPAPQLIARLARMRGELRAIVPPRLRATRKGQSRGYIAVHARIGYGVGEGTNSRFDLTKKAANLEIIATCLAKAATEEAEKADLPEPQMFYLATDTAEFASLFRAQIGNWSRRARVEGIGAKVVHSAQMHDNSQAHWEIYMNTGADIFFLSAGERLVSLKSGFSNLAKYLGDTPHRVIFIDQCVKDAQNLKLE